MTLLCVDVVPNCFNCSYVFGIFFRFNLKFFFSLHSALHLFDIFLVSLTFNASYRLNAIDRPSYTSIGDAFHFVSAKYLQRYCQRTQNEIHYVSKNRDTFYKQSNEYFFNKRTPKNTWSAWMCAHVNYNLKSSHANKIIIYIIFFFYFSSSAQCGKDFRQKAILDQHTRTHQVVVFKPISFNCLPPRSWDCLRVDNK